MAATRDVLKKTTSRRELYRHRSCGVGKQGDLRRDVAHEVRVYKRSLGRSVACRLDPSLLSLPADGEQ